MKAYFYKRWVDGSREACKPCTWPRGWRCSCGTWQELKRSRGNQVRQHVRDTACAVLSHFSRVPLLVALGTVACQLLCPWDFPDKNSEWVAMPSSRELPYLGIKLTSPALQADDLPLSHRGSPRDKVRELWQSLSPAPWCSAPPLKSKRSGTSLSFTSFYQTHAKWLLWPTLNQNSVRKETVGREAPVCVTDTGHTHQQFCLYPLIIRRLSKRV